MTANKTNFSLGIFFTSIGFIFSFLSIVFNLVSYVATGNNGLLKPFANLLFLLVALIISTLPAIKLFNNEKLKKLSLISNLFSLGIFLITFFTLNLIPFINEALKGIWSIYTIITVTAVYILFTLTINLLKNKSFATKASIGITLFGFAYFIITLAIGRLAQGGNILIIISVFIALVTVITAFAYIVNRLIKSKENKNKKYTKQF